MSLVVFFQRQLDPLALESLQANLDPGITLITGDERPDPANYHVLVKGRPSKEDIQASLQLHTLVIPWAGLPDVTLEVMKDFPKIAVHNLHHNYASTGESALALLFAAAKQNNPIERNFRRHDWRPRYQPNPAVLLNRKTILLLGFGHIGQYLARVCQSMGMQILVVRRHPEGPVPEEIDAEIYGSADLHKVLPRADILMVTVPGTKETTGMIGEKELALLPPDAIVVNVGRGPVIDQKAIYEALREGKLHSAGIDVWYNYPVDEAGRENTPPADYPFHELDNIVMSPHRGGGAQGIDLLRMNHLADLLNALARGESAPNKIDLQLGY